MEIDESLQTEFDHLIYNINLHWRGSERGIETYILGIGMCINIYNNSVNKLHTH